MATKLWAALLVLFTTLLTSSAQIFYKLGSKTLTLDPLSIITNYYLIGGLLLYAVGGILMIVSFRGGEVSVLYPIIATSYVWVSFLSIYFLGEVMNAYKWLGVLGIIAGIALIGFGSKDGAAAI
ncbi:EamA family transporter [Candidatus Woesearchaeota archaeon]|nr:EamA family transporter [Candidatus Woesearchaeota archaeon]